MRQEVGYSMADWRSQVSVSNFQKVCATLLLLRLASVLASRSSGSILVKEDLAFFVYHGLFRSSLAFSLFFTFCSQTDAKFLTSQLIPRSMVKENLSIETLDWNLVTAGPRDTKI